MKNQKFFVFRFILLLLIFVFISFIFVKSVLADTDTTPPTGTISINGGALFVNNRNITLTLSATDDMSGVAEMQFSNGGSYSAFEPYSTTKAWTLSASGDGLKTVRVKFKDGAGNITLTGIMTTTTLDTVLPTITLVGDSVLNLNVGDPYTEQGANAFDNNKGNFLATPTGVVDTTVVGVYTITYNATDDAGNSAVPIIRTVNINSVILPPPPVVTLSSISITAPATKLNYTTGESLDISGLIVSGTYSDGSVNILPVTISNITGFDNSVPVNNQVLTISIDGKITTYNINILEAIFPVVAPVLLIDRSSGSYLPINNKIDNQIKDTNMITTMPEVKSINLENNSVLDIKKNINQNTQVKKESIIKKETNILPVSQVSQMATAGEAIPNNRINVWILVGAGVFILFGFFYKIYRLK